MADWAFKAGIKEAEKQGFYCTLHPIHVQCLFKHEIGVELFNVFEKKLLLADAKFVQVLQIKKLKR